MPAPQNIRPVASAAPAGSVPLSRQSSQPMIRPGITAFQYTGPTALTAIGPLSGRRYQFPRTGAVVVVDPRDRASLATVPGLRQI